MATKLSKVECDKIANEIAQQEYAKLLKSGEKDELRTWFITSSKVTGILAEKFGTNHVAFYYEWPQGDRGQTGMPQLARKYDVATGCTGTSYVVRKYKDANDLIGECVFEGFATVPAFKS